LIVIDSSALIAIVNREAEREHFIQLIEAADRRLISAATLLETKMVILGRYGSDAIVDLMLLIEEIAPEIMAFDAAQAEAAFAAFVRFGKGRHAKAALNYCDCIAYALAKTMDAPLLFKGADFPETDIRACS
jgi:ribonuclease VapC